ncbi:MFS transporter [Yersinia sp. 2542 StPb PI]|uniref:MFS transporter n=1 Tax=Yersinia sp. 2542 StPb PI TaxID=3117408 RepID=UPI003B2839A5
MHSNNILGNSNSDGEFSSLIISVIGVILSVGAVYITQLIFQEISESFHVAVLDARYSFSVSCFIYAISFFIFGPLSDRASAKYLSLFGCAGVIFCLIICLYITNYNVFLLVMALLGFFAAAVPAALFAYTAKNTAADRLPQAMGLMISASIVGIIFSRSIIGILSDHFSWRTAFSMYAVLVLISALLIIIGLKENSTVERNHKKLSHVYINAAKMLTDRNIILFLSLGFLLFFSYLGLSSFLTYYLRGMPFTLSSTALGWLNFVGISAVGGAFISAKLAMAIDKKKIIITFLCGVSASILVIACSNNIYIVALGIFALFIFVFGMQPIVMSILNQFVDSSSKGTVSSLYLLSCLAGGSFGTFVLGLVWHSMNWLGVVIVCVSVSVINIILAINYIGKSKASSFFNPIESSK